MLKELAIKRVVYGKKDTPLEDREYKSGLSSAVGTLADWKDFARKNGYTSLWVVDGENEVLVYNVKADTEQKIVECQVCGFQYLSSLCECPLCKKED